jgi:YD repeat-containing protein
MVSIRSEKRVRSEYSLFFTCDDIVLSHRLALQVWLGQLTAASTAGPQWGLSFTYDGFGNRTAQTLTKGSGPTSSLTINPANNRITSSGFTYDTNRNLTAMDASAIECCWGELNILWYRILQPILTSPALVCAKSDISAFVGRRCEQASNSR